jgi:hypothetical protein
MIPNTRGHDSVIDGYAGHLPQPHDWLVHEVNDKLRQSRVEGVIVEGKSFCGRLSHFRPGKPILDCTEE